MVQSGNEKCPEAQEHDMDKNYASLQKQNASLQKCNIDKMQVYKNTTLTKYKLQKCNIVKCNFEE